ncbi:hypothetical protein HELRODRAFT_146072, partial [Helobdella robusta]|uniref:Uncharacterized protein n=1 Tax=Helobdella robusta TaxID=6412 RepID=T1EJQ1_HELRO
SSMSETLRSSISESRMCQMFCGGKNCKYDCADRWQDQQAIEGIYSTWITPNILAMTRPSTAMIEKYDIILQFKKAKIKSIINLQIPGEHEFCGQGLNASGFSYDPQLFM